MGGPILDNCILKDLLRLQEYINWLTLIKSLSQSDYWIFSIAASRCFLSPFSDSFSAGKVTMSSGRAFHLRNAWRLWDQSSRYRVYTYLPVACYVFLWSCKEHVCFLLSITSLKELKLVTCLPCPQCAILHLLSKTVSVQTSNLWQNRLMGTK